jgi:hypothetical protein
MGISATVSGSRRWRIVLALTHPSARGSASGPSKTERSRPPRLYLLMKVLVRMRNSHALRFVPA